MPPLSDPSDPELISRINAGDEAAFATLYHRHRDWAYRMACRITACPHHAEDVLQEVFRYFLGKFPGFELHCELRTFLYPAIRNLSVRMARKSRRFVNGESGAAALDQLQASPDIDNDHGDFHQIIADLGADHREILLLRFVDGMTLPEISTLVGIPLGTAKSRLHHALLALKSDRRLESLQNRMNDSPACQTQPTRTR